MGWLQSLIAVCLAVVAIVAGVLWYFLGHRMKNPLAAVAELATSRFKIPGMSGMPWNKPAVEKAPDVLGSLKADYPEAVDVLTHFEEDGQFSSLTENDENAERALADLRSYARNQSRGSRTPSSGLQLSAASRGPNDQQVKAALVTLFRTVYSNPGLVASLGDDGEQAMDAFLSSLTD